MYEKILVPLDGSGAAEIVLPYIEEIAAKFGSEIMLVSVSESKVADLDHLYRAYLERIAEQVRRQLTEYAAKGETKVYNDVLLGEPAMEILRYADESNVSLIAMASRGSSDRGPWLLGNIAAKVLRATSKPVLLIRTPGKREAFAQKQLLKRILVPLDGSRIGEAAIPCTETLAQALGAELVLFQVIETPTTRADFGGGGLYTLTHEVHRRKDTTLAYLDSMGKPLQEKGISTSSAVGLGPPADQIIDYATANNIDLIAMSTHGRSGIGRWVFGSVTDKVLHAGDTAVLIVPAARA